MLHSRLVNGLHGGGITGPRIVSQASLVPKASVVIVPPSPEEVLSAVSAVCVKLPEDPQDGAARVVMTAPSCAA
jgi:hypothetical protein